MTGSGIINMAIYSDYKLKQKSPCTLLWNIFEGVRLFSIVNQEICRTNDLLFHQKHWWIKCKIGIMRFLDIPVTVDYLMQLWFVFITLTLVASLRPLVIKIFNRINFCTMGMDIYLPKKQTWFHEEKWMRKSLYHGNSHYT